jgi:outer membrane receptor for ferrienterochelin and colicins
MQNTYYFVQILIATALFFSTLHTTATPDEPAKGTDANVIGHVVNKATGEHLPFMSIMLKGTTVGTYTDATGHFFLKNMPLGRHILVASGVGYKRQEREVVFVASQTLEVDFELEVDALMLEGVVVSANRNEANRAEAPVIVNVLTSGVFAQTNSTTLSDGLNFQPGLRVETNCQNCGFQQVRINGLDGPYSQILVNSRPIFSSMASVYGLEQIPVNMIERVEVIRGGGSALFGSSAIAGTINIITKEPSSNTISVNNTARMINSTTPDVQTGFNASVVSDDHMTGMVLFGSNRQRSAYDHDGDGFTELTAIRAGNIGAKMFHRINLYNRITAEYHALSEYRRGGNHITRPPHEADVAEQLEHSINTGGLQFERFSKDFMHKLVLYTSVQHIDRNSYFGAGQDPDAYGTTTDLSLVTGAQYNYSFNRLLFMPADVTAGAEYNLNDLHDQALGYGRNLFQTVHIASAYLQNEWKTDKWSILIGARLDQHSMMDGPVVSPRLNVRLSPRETVNLRISYGTGFRAPQAHDEDLHMAIAGGEAIVIRLAPDLKPERSQSVSLSADLYHNFGSVQTNILIEGFHTALNDAFILEEAGTDPAGFLILERMNGSGAVVQGVNFEGRIVPSGKFQVQFGATLQQSLYNEPEQWSESVTPQRRMFRTPDRYGYFTGNWNPAPPLNISLSATYTGSMLVQHYEGVIPKDIEKETPEFLDATLKLSYEFKFNKQSSLELNGGVQNIFNSYQSDFDQGEFRDAGYIYGPAMPRTLFIGLQVRI